MRRELLFVLTLATFCGTGASLIKYTVTNAASRGALCNDGSPAIYYLDTASAVNKSFWVIYLEGGGYCNTLPMCAARNVSTPILMTSNNFPTILNNSNYLVPALLSSNCSWNPAFCGAVKVFVHFCSSDLWAGNGGVQGPWQFNGRIIVQAVVEDLIAFHNLTNEPTTTILYCGSSAGGVGVTHTIDWLKNLYFSQAKFWGFDDSGFTVDYPPFTQSGTTRANISETGWYFWNVTLEGSPCLAYYPTEEWRCIFGPEPTEASQQPLFTFAALYDIVFLLFFGVITPPNDTASTTYIIDYGRTVHAAVCNISKPFFSHSGCIHAIALWTFVVNISINGSSIYDTLVDWFFEYNQLPHRAIENVDCYCTRMYNCNPTDPCDPGPGYQNGCSYQLCTNSEVSPLSQSPSLSPYFATTPIQILNSTSVPTSKSFASSLLAPHYLVWAAAITALKYGFFKK
jgi:hypothetical protein